ncbi:hypothetical protein [Salinicoccus sp. Marseille-QA3877]
MDKSERYLKEIANNTAEIAKELKKMNRKSVGNDKNDPEFERIRDALNSAPPIASGIQSALDNRN